MSIHGNPIVDELFAPGSSKVCLSEISKRNILTVEGEHAAVLIHSLVTSDVTKKLFGEGTKKPKSYNTQPALFLSAKGRVLFDTILSVELDSEGKVKNNNRIYIEHDASQTEELVKHLKTHILRKKVTMQTFKNDFGEQSEAPVAKIFSLFGSSMMSPNKTKLPYKWKSESVVSIRDPRLSSLGFRIYCTFKSQSEYDQFKQAVQDEMKNHLVLDNDATIYERVRLLSGIPENSTDAPSEVAFPLELGFEQIGGIHFDKGCYIGQELTTRTYHRGEIRKRFLIVRGETLPDPGTELQFSGEKTESMRSEKAGRMGSHDDAIGLALVKFEPIFQSQTEGEITVSAEGGKPLKFVQPYWLTL